MFSLHGKLSLNLIIFVLASFAFVSLFGIGMGMEVRDGQMSSCPLMASGTSLCQMSVTEHISQWQQAFLGVPDKTNFLALALLLAAAVLITFAKSLFQPKKLTELAARLFTYHKEHLVRIFDQLLIAFSDGILNPRIYEPAHI
jgi:hypothetical protein